MRSTISTKLTSLVRLIAVVLAVSIALSARADHASAAGALRLSALLYPAHTRITLLDPLSNAAMDCDWSFTCRDGKPIAQSWIYHLRTQDELHRLSGWAQLGVTGSHGQSILFAVFASRYSGEMVSGLPANIAAFSDFRGATQDNWYHDLETAPHLIPTGMLGNASVELLTSRHGDVLAMACWIGSIEVEGIAAYGHRLLGQKNAALRSLTRQMRTAVLVSLAASR